MDRSLFVANARIGYGIQNVCIKVAGEDENRGNKRQSHWYRIVSFGDCLNRHSPHARPLEHGFNNDSAAKESLQTQSHNGHYRQEGV